MFDIGGWEFLLIVVLGIIIIGPKDLPGAIRTVSLWVRRARGLAREFQSGLDEIMREAELDEVKKELQSDLDSDGLIGSIEDDVRNTIDPTGEMGEVFEDEGGRDWFSDHEDDATHGVDDDAALAESPEGEAPRDKEARKAGAKPGG